MISVCVATFNGQRYLAEQLGSILSELPADAEVLVCDDMSTDATAEIVRAMIDSRVQLHVNERRQGVVANFEGALRRTRGDIIFLSDQDDIWVKGRVQKMVRALESAILVQGDAIIVDTDGVELERSVFRLLNSGAGTMKNLVRNTYVGNSMGFRRHLLKYALPFPPKLPMHDWWLGLAAERVGGVKFVPEPVTKWRRHHMNVSPVAAGRTMPLTKAVMWRLSLLISLVTRQMARRRMQSPRLDRR